MLRTFALLTLLLLQAAVAFAQTTTSQISGSVVDASGRVVGAKVTLRNEATGDARQATTNETGDFIFPGSIRHVKSYEHLYAGSSNRE